MAAESSKLTAWQLLLWILACLYLMSSCSGQRTTTVTVPSLLSSPYTAIFQAAGQGGTVLQEKAGWLRIQNGTWDFVNLGRAPYYTLPYAFLLNSPFISNAGCVYSSYSSNWSTVNAYWSTEAGYKLAETPANPRAGFVADVLYNPQWNSTAVYQIPGTSFNNSRSGSQFIKVNSSDVYTFLIYVNGGQSRDRANLNIRSSTGASYRFAAYDTTSSVCKNATVVGGGAVDDTVPAKNSTLYLMERELLVTKAASMAAVYQNISCIAFQLLGVSEYTQVNSTGYAISATLQRDVTAFVTSTGGAKSWATSNFNGLPLYLGAKCQQLSQPGVGYTSNSTATFGFGTTAKNVTQVKQDITIRDTQTCQIVVDNLDPQQQYILWGVNGLTTNSASNVTADLRWAVRQSGSCAALEFPPPTYSGKALPPSAIPAPPTGPPPPPPPILDQANALYAEINTLAGLLGPLGAPAPAPNAPQAARVPLPPATPAAAPSEVTNAEGPSTPQSAPPQVPPLGATYIGNQGNPDGTTQSTTNSAGGGGKGTSSSLNGGAIAGIVVGGVTGLALTAILAFFLGHKRGTRKAPAPVDEPKLPDEAEKISGTGIWIPTKAGEGSNGMPSPATLGVSWDAAGSSPMGAPEAGPPSLPRSWSASSSQPPGAFMGGPPPSSDRGSLLSDHRAANSLVMGRGPSSVEGSTLSPLTSLSSNQDSREASHYPVQAGNSGALSIISGSSSGMLAVGDDWQIPIEEVEYVLDENGEPIVLGSGSFGKVYKAKLGKVHDAAVKELHKEHNEAQRTSMLKEVALLRSCRHGNIVNFTGISYRGNRILLVMEQMAGDLFHALHHIDGLFLWYQKGKQVALGIAQGLAYLHWRKIVHLDLKSANVLLTEDDNAKITDVGLAQALATDRTHLSEQQGFTFSWAAPEVLLGRPCKMSADVYSLGVVLWEIATGEIPRRGRMRAPRVPEECPIEVARLVERCVELEPDLRPTAAEVVHVLEELQ